MENFDMILKYLNTYNEDELFYKKCYELQNDPEKLNQYIQDFGMQEIKERRLIVPHLQIYPVKCAAPSENLSIPEQFIFDEEMSNRDAFLSKHNRYSPVYLHTHNYFELFYVMTGQCHQKIGDKYMTLHAGDLCFIAPYTHHTLEVFDDSIVINILIRISTFDDIFFNLLRSKNVLSLFFMNSLYTSRQMDYLLFQTHGDEDIYTGILSMMMEQMADDEYTNRIIYSLLSVFFTKLVRKYGKTATYSMEHKSTDSHLQDIISYIYDHYQSVTLNELAEHFHFTTAYCSRLIKSHTGRNFKDLLKDIRLRKAQNMLLTTNAKISDISSHLGYENKESFNRLFKQHYGMSPGAYRESAASAKF